ncbi:MAG: radical SAM protein [Bacilli bacterium]
MEITLLSDYNDVLKIDFGEFLVFYNLSNGKMVTIEKRYLKFKDMFFEKNKYFEMPHILFDYSKVIIGVNITSSCNLRCKYCFNDKKQNKKINVEQIKEFINYIVHVKDNADKYFVDLAGSGEPLLYIKEILEIARYCQSLSDEIGKEITPMLSTNGILLSKKMVSLLQNNGILFGVSLDGYEELHNKYRIDINNKPTYEHVLNNVLNIKHNDYVGGSMTIVDENTDIYKAYLEMTNVFKTVAIRPCRMSYENFNFDYILQGYERFVDYLIKQVLKNDFELLTRIINGDDFFGKIIIKVVSNAKLNRRCDAGLARFSLGVDGNIYPCAPASYHKELEITKKDIEMGNNNPYFDDYPDKCKNCISRNVCGSDCFVQLYEYSNNENLCNYKKRLFILATYFCGKIEINNFDSYCLIVNLVDSINSRNKCDEDLKQLYKKCSNEFTFTELKKIKDNNQSEYKKIHQKYSKC